MWSVPALAHGTPAMGKARPDAELINLQGCQHSGSDLNVLFRGWPLRWAETLRGIPQRASLPRRQHASVELGSTLLWNAFLRWLSPVSEFTTHSSASRLTVEIWGEQMVLGNKSQCLLWFLLLAEQVASGVSLTLPRTCVWRAGLCLAGRPSLSNISSG